MKRRHQLATAFALIPVACGGGQAQITAPKARHAITSTTDPEPAVPPTSAVVDPATEAVQPPPTATGSQGSTTVDEGRGGAASAPSTTTHPVSRPSQTVAEPETGGGATALVSYYGEESGSTTANGEAFDPEGLTFAHRSMAFGTLVRFTGPLGAVVARCNDRGPYVGGRTFDLSRGAFAAVAPLSAGVAAVSWVVLG